MNDSTPDTTTLDLHTVLQAAVARGASDVHLKAGRPPVVRFDGELEPLVGFKPLTSADLEQIVQEVGKTSRSRLSIFEKTGELDTAYHADDLPRFRVNAFRQRGEVSLAFRVIPKNVPNFSSLGLPLGVERLAEERRGLVLVTGATGSGKTTTLAAMIGHINRTRREHIVTIEDPIEILHTDASCIINQREVGLDTESFNEALRRALRQDPDVILIGEMRDSVTAETALQAAESGHLVLSTMHTVDASETLGRLVEFFPAAKQPQIRSILAGVLRGVISQRIVPRVDGGRVVAVEVMVVNSRIQELIRENKPEFIPEAIAEGGFFDMQTMTQALIELVIAGEVDEETATNAAPNAHDFTIALRRAVKERQLAESAVDEVAEAQAAPVVAAPVPALNADGLRLL
ncbi:MAG TPA: PilT/PilU family type 4a pilus ATPase [Gaiellaceae bacterium]|nr:PilT/PilU family type 4a pilus ATPase [Gaiellaceae bacterium]